MLTDVGVHIPYAKKETALKQPNQDQHRKANGSAITLKNLWPEPDWIASYLDGIPVEVLASLYGIYHSLTKKPHTTTQFSIGGVRVTEALWESSFVETVAYIKEACENATTTECIDQLKTAFDEKFNIAGRATYKTYAAGPRTPKTFFHPLGGAGTAGEYCELLPLLDWPLYVDPKAIPYFPIKLKHRETKQISYTLGKRNKKSSSWFNNQHGYENRFATYESAVEALVKHHSDEFLIQEEKQAVTDIYLPKKNHRINQGLPESYASKTPTELMQTYRFRGIQFGNYLPQRERQAYVNNAFHSLGLLSK